MYELCLNSLSSQNLNSLYHTIPEDYAGLDADFLLPAFNSKFYPHIKPENQGNLDIIKSVIYTNPLNLAYIPRDKITVEIAILALKISQNYFPGDKCHEVFTMIPLQLKLHDEVIRIAILKDFTIVKHLPRSNLEDPEFVEKLVNIDGRTLVCSHLEMMKYPELLKKAIQTNSDKKGDLRVFIQMSKAILDNRDIMKQAILRNGQNYEHIPMSHPLMNDKDLLLTAMITDQRNYTVTNNWDNNYDTKISLEQAFSYVHLTNFMTEEFYDDADVRLTCLSIARGTREPDLDILRECVFLNIPLSQEIEKLLEKAKNPIQFAALSGDELGEMYGWIFETDLNQRLDEQFPNLKGCDICFGDFFIRQEKTEDFIRKYMLEEESQGLILYPEMLSELQ
jgi:hypothetical protein